VRNLAHIANERGEEMGRKATAIVLMVLALGAAGCEEAVAREAAEVRAPAAAEFGFGPRPSARGTYVATLAPREPLRLRQLQTVSVRLVDANGRPVEGASISVGGGMPEHRHGLPTQPRATRALGDGVFEIEGLRFSMGGWWELTLAIESPAGVDNVTFNLSL
jgi:hypothetical protein